MAGSISPGLRAVGRGAGRKSGPGAEKTPARKASRGESRAKKERARLLGAELPNGGREQAAVHERGRPQASVD